jgi:hypothetical protein
LGAVQALFVHGMARSPVSGWPMLRHLQKAGIRAESFGYFVSLQSFAAIQVRLSQRIERMAAEGDYILIGHSLGGVLIRSALGSLPSGTRQPGHIFLLGSPVKASTLAQRLSSNLLFRAITRDCGNLLGSAERMESIPLPVPPATGIAGIKGISGKWSPFGTDPNDGVVSLPEVSANWLSDQVTLPIIHSFLPSSRLVAQTILQRVGIGDS